MSEKITLVNDGRISFAVGFLNETLHLAWGSGVADWDDPAIFPAGPPTPTAPDTALENEIGRRVVTIGTYVEPDAGGEIVFPDMRFAISTTPTRRIYIRTTFLKTEEPTVTIREVGLFMGTESSSSDDYLLPGDIDDPGRLVILYRFAGIARSPSRRESFEFVLTV
jgi:hypothetical protein